MNIENKGRTFKHLKRHSEAKITTIPEEGHEAPTQSCTMYFFRIFGMRSASVLAILEQNAKMEQMK